MSYTSKSATIIGTATTGTGTRTGTEIKFKCYINCNFASNIIQLTNDLYFSFFISQLNQNLKLSHKSKKNKTRITKIFIINYLITLSYHD